MKTLLCTLVVALGLTAFPRVGQAQNASPVTTALKAALRRSTTNMVAAAAEMPADKYGFKPTSGSMSFGQLILHVATSNTGMCQWLSGAAAAPKTDLTATSPKDQLVTLLKSSFAYCSDSLASLNDSNLSGEVNSYGGRKVSQAQLILTLSSDWADHYSQQAAYLRLNGLLPPTAQGRGRS